MNSKKKPNHTIDQELLDSFFSGDRLACSRLISLVDNNPALVPAIRDILIPHQKNAIRIGITGPPGVGKSTITALLVKLARQAGHSVGVIAVDPSSPFTGGAFLGDRIRMQNLIGDNGVFIRSLASRDGTGGLSPSTPYVADVFDAFGMDWIFIETVGVGQAELDVLMCADVVVLVLQPGTGDIIQALKTGILETGDIFIINKSDLPGADSLSESLRFMFDTSLGCHQEEHPPIIMTSSEQRQGMDNAFSVLDQTIKQRIQSNKILLKRISRMEREIHDNIQQSLWERFIDITDPVQKIHNISETLVKEKRSPYPFIRKLSSKVKLTKATG